MKVRITQHQPVPENEGRFVLSPSGDYGPFDPIEFYRADMPGQSYGAFQAQFIKFGGVAYREQDYVELLKQLEIIAEEKPETLNEMLLADPSVVVIDAEPVKKSEEPVASPESEKYSTTTAEATPPAETTPPAEITPPVEVLPDTTVITPTPSPIATSTPDINTSTTTESIIPTVEPELVSTSTPSFTPESVSEATTSENILNN